MSQMSDEEFNAMLLQIDAAAARAAATLEGRFADAFKELRALSPEEIDSITPDTSEQKEYERLIALIHEATARNMSQAELAQRIGALGETAKKIAEKTTALSALL